MISTIEDVLSSKQPLRTAIYVDKIINTHATAPGVYNQYQFEQWKEGIKNQRYSYLEQFLLSAFGKYTNFYLVDRQSLKQVIDEHKLTMSGLVSKESLTKLSEMLGLTHMIIIDFSRYQYKPKMVYDVERMRLIEIDTGRVLQSVSINYYVPV
jgi:hypothetical protein